MSTRYSFDGMRFDPATGDVEGGGERLSLPPQQAALLALLVERAGALVTRDEIYRVLWRDVHVDAEHGLNFCIRQLRLALGDDARAPRFIETVRGRGYRFVATVATVEPVEASSSRGVAIARIAAAVVVLTAVVLGTTLLHFETRPAPNPAAVDAYVAARHLATRSSAGSIQSSVTEFEKAIRLDPGYAPAHAGLAEVHIRMARWRLSPPDTAFRRAREAADDALRLDPSSAQALLARGVAELYLTFDWAASAPFFERAIANDPGAPQARLWYARSLAGRERPQEAIDEAEALVVADPSFSEALFDLGWFYYLDGRHEEATRTCRRVLEIDAEAFPAWRCLAITGMLLGRDAEAADAATRVAVMMGATPDDADALSTRASDVLTWAADALGTCPSKSLSIERAQFLALADRPEEALTSLREGFESLHPWAPFVALDPAFDDMRSDPAFVALMARAGRARSPEAP